MKKTKVSAIKNLLSGAERTALSEKETNWMEARKLQIHNGVWHTSIFNPTEEDRQMAKQLDEKLRMHIIFIEKHIKA